MPFKPVGVDENSLFPGRVETRIWNKVAQMISAVITLPPGGDVGQVLVKLSDEDGDASWQDIASGGGAVDSVNGETGVVVLDATDVGAAPTVHTHNINQVTGLADGLASKVPATRTVAGKELSADITLDKADVGLDNVTNTSDANKPVSSAQQAALDAKVPSSRTVNGQPLTANVTVTKADVGLGNADNTSDTNKPLSTAMNTALLGKANVSHIHSASDVTTGSFSVNRGGTGRSSLDPYAILAAASSSTGVLQQIALGTAGQVLKSAGPGAVAAFTDLVKGDVGLGNVDNTSDANKPISTATQTALDGKAPTSHTHAAGDITGTMPVSRGGSGRSSHTAYGLISGGSNTTTAQVSIAVGTAGQVLKSGGASALAAFADLAKGDVGLGNVDNTSDAAKPISTATQTALDGKAATAHTHQASVIVGGTLTTTQGGTGKATHTAYSLVAGGTSTTGSLQNIPTGTAGQFLKSAGASALAAFASFVAADISDSTAIGRALLKAVNVVGAQEAAGIYQDPDGTKDPATVPEGSIILRREQ